LTAISEFEQRLSELVFNHSTDLNEAMRYALFGPGKRIRPQLIFAACEAFQQDYRPALDPACAIEMIHTYSLIHDDLPCMDDDDIRRGRPTVHRAFSEALAVLAGDALLTEAFRVLAVSQNLSDHEKIDLISTLSLRAGVQGMVAGQAIDIQASEGMISDQLLLEMDRKKTGDLLSCCLEFGAIIAHQEKTMVQQMRQIGLYLGLAYQIRDDLEDAEQPTKAGSDEGKPTSLTVLGQKKARLLMHESIDAMNQGLAAIPGGALAIRKLLDSLFLVTDH
jgi:geranylgeranyl diphosphate synthase, type II